MTQSTAVFAGGEPTGTPRRRGFLALFVSFAVVLSGAVTSLAGQDRSGEPPERRGSVARASEGWIGISFERDGGRAAPGAPGSGVERPDEGVLISGVFEGSPAARAGIRPGESLVRLNGDPVRPEELVAFARRLRAGDSVDFTVAGAGGRREVTLTAGERPDYFFPTLSPEVMGRFDSIRIAVERRVDSLRVRMRAERGTPGVSSPVRFGARNPEAGTGRDAEPLPVRLRSLQMELLQARKAHAGLASRAEVLRSRGEEIAASDEARMRELERRSRQIEVALQELYGELTRWSGSADRQAQTRVDRRAGAPTGTAPPAPAADASTGIPPRPPLPRPYSVGSDYVAGARLAAVDPSLGEYFGVDRGILVVEVLDGSPADEAGLRPGDVVMAVEEMECDTVDQLRAALMRRGRQPSTLRVVRKQEEMGVRLSP